VIFTLLSLDIEFWAKLVLLALFACALLVAIIPHEVAHGYAALKMGDPSAKVAGRLSLNPKRHMEPMGLLAFCIMGIGWAKPVPVNPFNFKNYRRGNFVVSVAGVLTNLVLAFILSFALFLVVHFTDFRVNFNTMNSTWTDLLGMFLYLCVLLNITLMLFNLLPICPLDGFNMLESYTKPNNRFMAFMRENSMWVLMLTIIVLFLTNFFGIVTNFVLEGFMGFWGLMF